MIFIKPEFVLTCQLDEKLRAIVIGRKDLALGADDQATTARHFATKRFHVSGDFLRRFATFIMAIRVVRLGLSTIVPPETGSRDDIILGGKTHREIEPDF